MNGPLLVLIGGIEVGALCHGKSQKASCGAGGTNTKKVRQDGQHRRKTLGNSTDASADRQWKQHFTTRDIITLHEGKPMTTKIYMAQTTLRPDNSTREKDCHSTSNIALLSRQIDRPHQQIMAAQADRQKTDTTINSIGYWLA